MNPEPCDIELDCPKCGSRISLLNKEPNICYECPDCHQPFHTEQDESGELIVVLGCL